MSREVDLVIKYNNCVTNDPCGICGARTDPLGGPDVFVEGTWSLVCWPCVKKHNPTLAAMMQVLHDGTGRDWQALAGVDRIQRDAHTFDPQTEEIPL